MIPFFGASVYDDPSLRESSPINFIKKVKTPTLSLSEIATESVQLRRASSSGMRCAGKGRRRELVIYSNEGHAFRDPEHRRDVLERALRWFETEMPVKSASAHDEEQAEIGCELCQYATSKCHGMRESVERGCKSFCAICFPCA